VPNDLYIFSFSIAISTLKELALSTKGSAIYIFLFDRHHERHVHSMADGNIS